MCKGHVILKDTIQNIPQNSKISKSMQHCFAEKEDEVLRKSRKILIKGYGTLKGTIPSILAVLFTS